MRPAPQVLTMRTEKQSRVLLVIFIALLGIAAVSSAMIFVGKKHAIASPRMTTSATAPVSSARQTSYDAGVPGSEVSPRGR